MAEPDEEADKKNWVKYVQQALRNDPVVSNLPTRDPTKYTIREDIVRVRTETRERVVIPDAIAWDLVEKIHKYLVHFGTDKVTEFTERYFAINNADRIVRDVVASCHICLATKIYIPGQHGVQNTMIYRMKLGK